MRNNPTVRRRRITLVRKDDSVRIILAWAIVVALEECIAVARVAHERELKERAVRAIGEIEGWRLVEKPFEGVEGGLRPVFKLVRVIVFAWWEGK